MPPPPPRQNPGDGPAAGGARHEASSVVPTAGSVTGIGAPSVVFGALTAELAGVAERLASVVAQVDAGSVLATEAVGALGELDRIVRLATGGRLKLAARAAEAQVWKTTGHRSAAEWLAGRAGCGVREARGLLGASERLAELPQVAQAVERGELSLDQAVAVTDGAAANPAAEAELLAIARAREAAEEPILEGWGLDEIEALARYLWDNGAKAYGSYGKLRGWCATVGRLPPLPEGL